MTPEATASLRFRRACCPVQMTGSPPLPTRVRPGSDDGPATDDSFWLPESVRSAG
jgi:hypothetical protein